MNTFVALPENEKVGRVTTSAKISPPQPRHRKRQPVSPCQTTLCRPPFRGTSGFGRYRQRFCPRRSPLSGTHGYQTLRHWGVDGEIARDSIWPTVVPVRVRPAVGGCAGPRILVNPPILRPNYRSAPFIQVFLPQPPY